MNPWFAILIALIWAIRISQAAPQLPPNVATRPFTFPPPRPPNLAPGTRSRPPRKSQRQQEMQQEEHSTLLQQAASRKLGTIKCFRPHPGESIHPTSLHGCGPVLDDMAHFARYDLPQPFQEWRSPADPFVPPGRLTNRVADCDIYLMAISPLIVDVFSWRDIRTTIEGVLRSCEGQGFGGITDVGHGVGWMVSVEGRQVWDEVTAKEQEAAMLPVGGIGI